MKIYLVKILSIISVLFSCKEVKENVFTDNIYIEKDNSNKELLLSEDFSYTNIEEFVKDNSNKNVKYGWETKNMFQFTPNLISLDKKEEVNNLRFSRAESENLSSYDFASIINMNKESSILKKEDRNWLRLSYKLPILNNNDSELLRKMVKDDSFKSDKIKKLNVYFSRNEISTNKIFFPENEYEVSWTVNIEKGFADFDNRIIVGQIHHNSDFKYSNKEKRDDSEGGVPLINVSANNKNGKLFWNILATKIDSKNDIYLNENYELVEGNNYNFKIKFKLSSNNVGYVEVWVNDVLFASKHDISTNLKEVPSEKGMSKFKFGIFKIGIYEPAWNGTIKEISNRINYKYKNLNELQFFERNVNVSNIKIYKYN